MLDGILQFSIGLERCYATLETRFGAQRTWQPAVHFGAHATCNTENTLVYHDSHLKLAMLQAASFKMQMLQKIAARRLLLLREKT